MHLKSKSTGQHVLKTKLRTWLVKPGDILVSTKKKALGCSFNDQCEYFTLMRQEGAWAEDLEIASAACLFGLCIHVFCPSRCDQPYSCFAPSREQESRPKHMYLLNKNGRSHYECMIVSNGEGNDQSISEEEIVTPANSQKETVCPHHHYVVFVEGRPNKTVASEHQSQSWWRDALALCPRVTQDPKSFAWTHFFKDSREKQRQDGSLHPNAFQILIRETVAQHHQKQNLKVVDLGSEAGMALWHYMLHPSIGTVTGIEIDEFWFDVSVTLISHISKCARQANVHVANVMIIKQDFLDSDVNVNTVIANADIVYCNNVQFSKNMKRVPVAQQSVSRSHPFKDTVNTNLAAKIFSLFLRDRVILALFEHDAFLSIKTKLIKKLELNPTWGCSKTDVALLLHERHREAETPRRLKSYKRTCNA
jgi:hypothetical protein